MRARRRSRLFRPYPELDRRLAGGSGERPHLRWKDVRSLLLRGALVVGLAMFTVAALLSNVLFTHRESPGDSPPVVIQQSVAEAEIRAREQLPATSLDPIVFSPDPGITGALPLTSTLSQKTSREDSNERGTTMVPRSDAPPPVADTPADTPRQAEVADMASAEAAMLSGRTFLNDPPLADAERVSIATTPPAPEQEPAKVRPASSRGRASTRPSDPPPYCGSRHAYWKVVSGTSTWYCR